MTERLKYDDPTKRIANLVNGVVEFNLVPCYHDGSQWDVKAFDNLKGSKGYMSFEQDFDGIYSGATSFSYVEGMASFHIFADEPELVVNSFEDILLGMGFKNTEGRLAPPDRGPYDVNGQQVMMFKPLGFDRKARKFGVVWRLDVGVDAIICLAD